MDSVKSFILDRFGRLDGLGGSSGTLLQYISFPNPNNPSLGSRLLCLLNIIPDTLSIPGALKLRPNWGLPDTIGSVKILLYDINQYIVSS